MGSLLGDDPLNPSYPYEGLAPRHQEKPFSQWLWQVFSGNPKERFDAIWALGTYYHLLDPDAESRKKEYTEMLVATIGGVGFDTKGYLHKFLDLYESLEEKSRKRQEKTKRFGVGLGKLDTLTYDSMNLIMMEMRPLFRHVPERLIAMALKKGSHIRFHAFEALQFCTTLADGDYWKVFEAGFPNETAPVVELARGNKGRLEGLFRRAAQARDDREIYSYCWIIGRLGAEGTGALGLLWDWMSRPDPEGPLRGTIYYCVSRLAPHLELVEKERWVDRMLTDTRHPGDYCRKGACFALGELGIRPAESVPALIERIGDNEGHDETVHEEAVRALGRFGPLSGEAVPRLLECLKENREEWYEYGYLVTTLGLMGRSAEPARAYLEEIQAECEKDLKKWSESNAYKTLEKAVTAIWSADPDRTYGSGNDTV